ncbi:CitMHS family transporter [Phenylobacterium immobile]|uniref:CitMHS family transporter n=1 Tax=Phenylobacterium immobile TaxID=21 RepID=UPI000AEBFFF6|nr:citrate:proton symporter [Phenylobacterium immobile]
MLALLAFAMVFVFMAMIMTKRLSALAALILVPAAFGVIAGHAAGLGPMMLEGVKDLAPTGIMLLFAILYFGIMIDAGLFDPLVARIVRIVGDDPVKILVGTAALALIVSIDGDGATTYMITAAAMAPLYRSLRLDMRKMACVIIMAAAVTNLLPWGGPTARAASALKLDPAVVFTPLIPAMAACAAWVLFTAYVFGRQEKARLARLGAEETVLADADTVEEATAAILEADRTRDPSTLRPRLVWVNFALTAALMAALVMGLMPLPILFILAFAAALMINYPALGEQRRRIAANAGNAVAVVSLIFAAGCFMGVLSGTGMGEAMANAVSGAIPPQLGPFMAPITALVSMPFTFLISNDAFYFGVLPTLAQAAATYGVPVEAVARASLVGQQIHLLSPLVASTYLLVGLSGIELGEHQRFTFPWALAACAVMLVAAMATGAFPLMAG